MSHLSLKKRTRSDYGYHLEYRTRWSDNDMYHHMNNSIYSFLFDSIINTYLITHCSLHPPTSPQIGIVVSSHCDFFIPVAFPAVLDLALRVNRIGKSSVEYEVAVFEQGMEDARAVGGLTHVFVERDGMKVGLGGMEESIRRGLEGILWRNGAAKL